MDIQVSSNFERLLFEASGRDAAMVRRLMASLKIPETQARDIELNSAAVTATVPAAEIKVAPAVAAYNEGAELANQPVSEAAIA